MDIVKTLTTALKDADSVRDRSTQVEIGASSIGGCKAQAWHIINQTPKTNDNTESLATILGTAIHSVIAEALEKYDVFGDDFMIEQEFNTDLLKGHVDFYSRSAKLIADWKTTSLKGLAKFPTAQQKMQVNLYGYLLTQNGYEVEQVALVAIPRDGKMSDIRVWQDKYSPYQAEKGLAWLKDIQAMDSPPPPERPAFIFCKNYCSYYDKTGEVGCPGKSI
jgi:hypothetical protein